MKYNNCVGLLFKYIEFTLTSPRPRESGSHQVLCVSQHGGFERDEDPPTGRKRAAPMGLAQWERSTAALH